MRVVKAALKLFYEGKMQFELSIQERAEEVITPVVEKLGYEVVEIKYVRAGKPSFFSPTGIVDIFLVGTDGQPLSSEIQEELLDRIEPFKDIAVLHISEFERTDFE